MLVAYLGPEGTFTQAAALTAPAAGTLELVAHETIHDTVLAVRDGSVERAIVPIENSLEGSVNVTLDALVLDAADVRIVGETVLGVEQCLIAQEALPLDQVEVVISHPQATAQCRDYIRTHMPEARVMTSSSTAEAVRLVSERIRHRWVAIGTRLAAELYDCVVLEAGIEDVRGNETRFVWLAQDGAQVGVPGAAIADGAPWKTAIVFWGVGADGPGWLVGCLSELAFRGVNLTRIESRPLRAGLGSYMFFVDLDGGDSDPQVLEALTGLRGRVNELRTLGSFPAA
ncbi:MAG TPA: prephenate dehydratase [Solirubrobacteraceae bacterium]|jgi:prephenate dehydratase|nr:prephenate dehydratase [Solirubrobacteraceae bacterium]